MKHQVTFALKEGRLLSLVEDMLKMKFIEVSFRGTHVAAFLPTEKLAKRAEQIRDEWRDKNIAKCDGPDCPNAATYTATLAKSAVEVTLCGFHATKFALRGLLRATKGPVPRLELEATR